MKLFLLSVFLSLNLSVFAQLKPIYFLGDNVISDSTKATSFGIYGKLSGDSLYALKVFDLDNNLKMTGTYKDDSLKIPHGNFVYYDDVNHFNEINATSFVLKDKTRFILGKGSFVEGKQTGRWVSFFPDGKIMNITSFVKGIQHGFYGLYDRKGNVLASGAYVLGKRNGEWLFKKGRVKEVFVNGIKQEKTKT